MKPKRELDQVPDAQALEPAVREMASVLRRHRLDYRQAIYVAKRARERVGLLYQRPPQKLPKNLTKSQREAFFRVVEKASAEHALLFRLMYVTGLRVSELVKVRRDNVDLDARTIRVNQGKGSKDRVVPFPEALLLPLRLHLSANTEAEALFESRRRQPLTSRWVQVLAKRYGEAAGITDMHPHRLRHSILSDLSSALTDAQLQIISGHATKTSLEVYQSLSLANVQDDYDAAMSRQPAPRQRS